MRYRARPLVGLLALAASAAMGGCFTTAEGDVVGAQTDGDGGALGADGGFGARTPGPRQQSDKVDVLFVVDNSRNMRDKSVLLRDSVATLLGRLLRPDCVDVQRIVVGQADTAGNCTTGVPQFAAVRDLHVGFISSSLGSASGDTCATDSENDRAHLLTRVEPGAPALSATADFLSWSKVSADDASVASFVRDAQSIVGGIGETGCGYEAPLEAAYRFLVQPDPYERLVRNGEAVELQGIDLELLRQRKAFLRPDSLVLVVMLTDENDASLAPTGFGGRSWFFGDSTHVRPGTVECSTNPVSSACESCYRPSAASDPGCQMQLDDSTDHPNIRFFHPKRRFGYDPLYPVARYVNGFTNARVPSHAHEFVDLDYTSTSGHDCVNPLFAAALPSEGSSEVCALTPGPRTPDLVHFAVIGGVPWQLLTAAPENLDATSAAPFKSRLQPEDYTRFLGRSGTHYDFTGQHPLMRESVIYREGAGADGAHLREFNTLNTDLQFACTFELDAPRDCALPENQAACSCSEPTDSPLCDQASPKLQRSAGAYPSLRPIAVASALGEQATVGSVCPRNAKDRSRDDYGYRPALRQVIDHIAPSLKEP